jgi:hypothetical protein
VGYKDGKFIRVQVKYITAKNNILSLCFKTSWTDKNGTHSKFYDKDEIDVMCIYCPNTDKCYYIDPKKYNKTVCLRISPTKNNQKSGVKMATDFLDIPQLAPAGGVL